MNPHRALAAAALLLAGAAAFTGCSATSPTGDTRPDTHPSPTASSTAPTGQALGPTAAATPAAVPAGSHLSPTDFANAASAPGTVLLDVRTPAEFAAGHLPGAINIDVEAADFAAGMSGQDKGASYAVYCHSGRRSAQALHQLDQLGFHDAYDLDGGIAGWTSAGGQIVAGP